MALWKEWPQVRETVSHGVNWCDSPRYKAVLVDRRAGCVEEGVLVRHRIAVELVAGSKPQGIGAMILDAGCGLEDAAPAGARDPAGGIKSGRLAEPKNVRDQLTKRLNTAYDLFLKTTANTYSTAEKGWHLSADATEKLDDARRRG